MRSCETLVAVLLALAASTCGGTPPAPGRLNDQQTAPSGQTAAQPGPSVPSATYQGWVSDSGARPIAGARIEALDGAQAGYAMTSDAQGNFSVPSSFDESTTFRASHDGHQPATRHLRAIGTFKWLGFSLLVLAPNVNIADEFTLSVTADERCTQLPSHVRARTYPATIALEPVPDDPGQNTRFMVVASGPTIDKSDPLNRPFIILVAGDYLYFATDDGHHAPFLVETLEEGGSLSFTGEAETHAVEPIVTISALMNGTIGYVGADGARANCTSDHHRIALIRR